MPVKPYTVKEPEPLFLAEPAVAYQRSRPRFNVRPRGAARPPVVPGSLRPEQSEEYAKTREWYYTHMPEWLAKEMEERQFMFNQPFPSDVSEEEYQAWLDRVVEDDSEETYLSAEESTQIMNAWRER